MILMLEMDVRAYGARRWQWCLSWFRGRWQSGHTWRLVWGLWSISYYPEPGIREFFNHVEDGSVRWYDK